MKVPLGGGDPVVLACSQATPTGGITVDDAYVYWGNYGVRDANQLFTQGTVMEIPTAGGAPTTQATAQPCPSSIRTDATSIYRRTCGDEANGRIMILANRAGTNLAAASYVLGHRDRATTSVYVHADEDAAREIAKKAKQAENSDPVRIRSPLPHSREPDFSVGAGGFEPPTPRPPV